MPPKPPKKAPRRSRAKSKNFNMKIPETVWDRLEAVASERGVSVAALLLSTTMEKIGPG